MKLTSDQVKTVAKLANLPLTANEENLYAEQLSKILDYIDQLDKANTSSVEPTFNVTGLSNVMRKDEAEKSLPKNGPYKTKGVFEG
ncbi:MAG: Asp-tRNA(Asn)/Glu-tRNA(Gln) amidotransferase subunit GatC [Candidatus Daviesbacteria bacterium]|nr:Asp-tRNA(Asn)/Glu-tRNA(Gln) amidotransferase subunit GatC [Candidatus Daviesbacteria bacterium]